MDEGDDVLFGIEADHWADVGPETAEPSGLEAGPGEEGAKVKG